MKNLVVCKNCNSENPFYALNCINCKAYLRERVYNIDFWTVLFSLIDNPLSAFRKIIHAEHKNFTLIIILLAALKLFILSIFIQAYSTNYTPAFTNLFIHALIFLAGLFVLLLMFSLIITFVDFLLGLSTRIKDNFSVVVYAFIPYIVGLVFIFPVELVVFGQNLFSVNPGPFQIKPILAYMLFVLESIIVLWAMLLNGIAMFIQSKNKIYSLITDFVYYALLSGYCYYFWKLIK
jgi:hypothetical protein